MDRKSAALAITKPKNGPGGARPGAGCPKGMVHVSPEDRRIPVQIRLPQHLVDWLYTLDPSLTKSIEYAVNHLKEKAT